METSNVRSGVGCVRDGELANGEKRRLNSKNYNDGIDRERLMHPPMLNHEFGHRDYVEGDLVSRKEKHIVPLDPGLEFAGIVERIGEDRGRYVASVCVRGALCVKVRGLDSTTRQGAKVFAMPAGRTQAFSLMEPGVLVGEVCAIESLERGMAIVGFRLADDRRRFELGGNRP